MASARRDAGTPVIEGLRQKGYAFDFFQAVRILEAMRADAPPVGSGSDPSLEAVRFRSDVSLAFPASEIVDVAVPEKPDGQATVTVSFLGVAGGHGPLPRPFTELILERVASGDSRARDFLDIFNHRLVSLLYRAREKHRVGLRIQPPERSLLADMGFSLIGLGGATLRDRMRIGDRSLLFYAGVLSHARRTAAGLEGLLSHYFQAVLTGENGRGQGRVRIREFVGRWHTLEADQRTALGVKDGRCGLGVDAVVGGRVWDQQGMIEVALGPLDYAAFQRFLPGGDALEPLVDIVAFYLKGDLDFVVRLVLRAGEVPATVLRHGPRAARLGLTSWLKTRPFERDAADVLLGSPSGDPLSGRLTSEEGRTT